MTMKAAQYVRKLEEHFARAGDKKVSEKAAKYLLNKFSFYGLSSPARKIATKDFIAIYGFPEEKQLRPTVKLLWKKKHRELHYFAMEMLEKNSKQLDPADMDLLVELVIRNSWWDSIDFIAPKLIGVIFKKHPELIKEYTTAWINSRNIWLMRSAILFQLKYKKETREKVLFDIIRRCAREKDFFIRKAIGWSLREYSKTEPVKVRTFVRVATLSSLSRKEALKRIAK
jgi:3-methyladenine DNA glycosylase AlkD